MPERVTGTFIEDDVDPGIFLKGLRKTNENLHSGPPVSSQRFEVVNSRIKKQQYYLKIAGFLDLVHCRVF